MITAVGPRECRGCGAPVNAWDVNGHEVIRERSITWAPVHVCADPDRWERVDMTLEQFWLACPACGDTDVAYSSWGRLVDFPADSIWAEGWVGMFSQHVCATERNKPPQQRSQIAGVEVPTL